MTLLVAGLTASSTNSKNIRFYSLQGAGRIFYTSLRCVPADAIKNPTNEHHGRIDFMRNKIRSYDDPANFDITNRPTPRSLTAALWFGFFLNGFPGAVILPLIYTWVINPPQAGPVIALAVVGAGIGMGLYFPRTKREGCRKRREFTKAGGDASEYSDLQCGVLGGWQKPDGGWQWTSPSSDI